MVNCDELDGMGWDGIGAKKKKERAEIFVYFSNKLRFLAPRTLTYDSSDSTITVSSVVYEYMDVRNISVHTRM